MGQSVSTASLSTAPAPAMRLLDVTNHAEWPQQFQLVSRGHANHGGMEKMDSILWIGGQDAMRCPTPPGEGKWPMFGDVKPKLNGWYYDSDHFTGAAGKSGKEVRMDFYKDHNGGLLNGYWSGGDGTVVAHCNSVHVATEMCLGYAMIYNDIFTSKWDCWLNGN